MCFSMLERIACIKSVTPLKSLIATQMVTFSIAHLSKAMQNKGFPLYTQFFCHNSHVIQRSNACIPHHFWYNSDCNHYHVTREG